MRSAIAIIAIFFTVASSAQAMPWDVDMYRQQSLVPGEIARLPVKGTIPLGYKPWKMTTQEATDKLKNPTEYSEASIERGKRVYNSNCVPCHGVKGDSVAPVGKAMAVPNLITEFYANKADGSIYGILMNGGSNMPRYGYKFSEEDRWNLINYVRFLQGKKRPVN
jgi:mono/diheme cytochrome c family protein